MADLEFDVAKRRRQPVTFRLGGEMLLHPATEPHEEDDPVGEGTITVPGEPEVRGPDDHDYVFTPPKSAVMLMPVLDRPEVDAKATSAEALAAQASEGMAMTKATFNWLGKGLSEADNDRILGRLRDDDDDLDVETLSDIVSGLSEKVAAGRPTT